MGTDKRRTLFLLFLIVGDTYATDSAKLRDNIAAAEQADAVEEECDKAVVTGDDLSDAESSFLLQSHAQAEAVKLVQANTGEKKEAAGCWWDNDARRRRRWCDWDGRRRTDDTHNKCLTCLQTAGCSGDVNAFCSAATNECVNQWWDECDQCTDTSCSQAGYSGQGIDCSGSSLLQKQKDTRSVHIVVDNATAMDDEAAIQAEVTRKWVEDGYEEEELEDEEWGNPEVVMTDNNGDTLTNDAHPDEIAFPVDMTLTYTHSPSPAAAINSTAELRKSKADNSDDKFKKLDASFERKSNCQ